MAGIQGFDNIKKALEKYKGGGKTNFFSLPNDGDTAKVRFLNGAEDDLNLFVVHRVKIGDKERYVKCLEVDNCPLCQAGNYPQLKMFLFLVDRRDGQLKMWERGRTFVPEILGFIQRYGGLNTRDYELVRHGKAKDPKTTFQLFPDDKKADKNLPEMPVICGEKSFILVKSIAEMRSIAEGSYVAPEAATAAAAEPGDVF